jgi:hypothetical protein
MSLREFSRRSVRRAAAPCILAALVALTVPAASAGGLYTEHVHADSFGNLVVYSPSGYKRIVVGRGYLADEMAAQNRAVYSGHRHYGGHERFRPCKRHGVLLHGRSYMYGLPDNVVPVLVSDCK